MHYADATAVEDGPGSPKKQWADEIKAAIESEEDPHRAALDDNPEQVYVGKRTWAAIFGLSLSLGAPIGLSFLSLAAVADAVTRELGAEHLQSWVVGAWAISSACSAVVAGYLSDTFGRRNVIIIGDLVVLVGSIMGGTAHSVEVLIAAQSLIGFGTGFVFDAFAAVPEMLPNKWRALGCGIVEGGVNVPWATISVLLAQAVTRYASWRWIYYICILLSFITFKVTALLYWPVSRPRGDFDKTRWQQIKELDYVGIVSVTGGLMLLVGGLTWGGVTFPWRHAGSVVPIVVGFATMCAGFCYDCTVATNPMVPRNLFFAARQRGAGSSSSSSSSSNSRSSNSRSMFGRYTAMLVLLFVSGINFHAMSSLLPQGSALMFTTDGLRIGLMSLPNTTMQLVAGFGFPLVAHRVPAVVPRLTIKWQVVLAMAMQAVFLALSALSVGGDSTTSTSSSSNTSGNNLYAYILLPALGVPMFTWVTILTYAIAGLHVPHSQLGVALGILGSFRSTGGAVGNAAFNALFRLAASRYTAAEVQRTACSSDLQQQLACPNSTAALAALVAETAAYNAGEDYDGGAALLAYGATARDALQAALRLGYGRAFRVVFLATLAPSLVALACALCIEDPTPYMNNHIQFRMYERGGWLRGGAVEEPELTGARGVYLSAGSSKMKREEAAVGTELGRVRSQGSKTRLHAPAGEEE